MFPISLPPTSFDISTLKLINQFHPLLLNNVMVLISNIGEFGVVWLGIGLIAWYFNRKNGWQILSLVILAMLIGVFINDVVLKEIFFRSRPYLAMPDIFHAGPNWINSSFPSGHAISSVAATIILAKFYPKLTLLVTILAVLMIWTRFYLGMHYPSDILAGIIIGFLSAIIAFWISKKFPKYPSRKKLD